MKSRARVWMAFLSIYFIWGSTYLAIRIAIETVPPFLMAAVRYTSAGLLLLGWVRLRGEHRATWREWREAAIVGGLMLLGGNGLVSWAEQFVPSGLTALVISTIPIWVVLLDWLWLKSARPSPGMFLGLVLGLVGVGLLVRPGTAPSAPGGVPVFGAMVLILAAISWAAGGLYASRAKLPSSSLLSAAMQMIAGGGLLVLAGTASGEWSKLHLSAVSPRSLLALAYLVLFGSLVGLTSYLWLIKETTPAKASTYAFVNPVVAILLGWALAGETLGPRTALAAAVALSGVVLIVRGRSRRAPLGT
jgi:drug/metabolite transporter (DMT)-like permease